MGPRFGVAGLILATSRTPPTEDWIAMYEGLGETGELLGVYDNWRDAPNTGGAITENDGTPNPALARWNALAIR